ESITKSWAGLAGLLLLFLFIAQFIAYFNYSQIADVAAVKLGDVLERINVGAVWLLVGAGIITLIVDLFLPQALPKWALLPPLLPPSSSRSSPGSAWPRRPCSPPTASATHRSTC